MKKFLIFLTLCMLSLFAAGWAHAASVDVWTASSYINVFQDFTKADDASAGYDLVVARNEGESFQILMRSDAPFTIEKVSFTDLVSDNKGRIGKENLSYNYVEYVYMGENSGNQNVENLVRSGAGYYPDPLSNDSSYRVEANATQPIWVTLDVPRKARPGLYKGEVTLYTTEGEFRVPVTAEVNDVVIPDAIDDHFDLMIHQQIAGTWWYDTTRTSHPRDVIFQIFGHERWTPEWWALVGDMADWMKRTRMNVLFVNTQQLLVDGPGTKLENGRFTFDWSKFDEYIEFFLDRKVVNKFEGLHLGSVIGAVGETFYSYILTNNEQGEICTTNVEAMSEKCQLFHSQFLSELYAHLKKKGWLSMWIQHIGDEALSDLQHRQYGYYMEHMKSQAPDMQCGDPTFSLKSAQNAVAKGATVVTPIEELYQGYKADFDAMQQNGTTVYCYNCCGPHYHWLNRMLDLPVWQQRLLGWLSYKWGISGWLHWGWNFWVDWFQDSFQTIDNEYYKGDHYSVYPDTANNRIKGSIRTEALRDMDEEFELLYLLGQHNPELARRLVDKVAVNASDSFVRDPAIMNDVRTELIRACAVYSQF